MTHSGPIDSGFSSRIWCGWHGELGGCSSRSSGLALPGPRLALALTGRLQVGPILKSRTISRTGQAGRFARPDRP